MLRWALIFFLISLVAGGLGFTGLAAGAGAAAKVLFFISISLFALLLIAGLVVGEKLSSKSS